MATTATTAGTSWRPSTARRQTSLEADAVQHLLDLGRVGADHAHGHDFGLEGAQGLEGRVVGGQAVDDRVLVVAVGEVVLGRGAGQVLQELLGGVGVRRVAGHGTAGDVDVGTATGLVREHHADLFHRLAVLGLGRAHHAGDVVAVGQRDLAFAGGHGLDLVGVAALGRAGHVVHQALEPGFGGLRADVLEHRAEQAQVVGVGTGAGAEAALVLRVGQFLVGVDVLALDAGLLVDDDARPGGET